VYDPGSCMFGIQGCTDSRYSEYSPAANIDDGTCGRRRLSGCSDPRARNFNSEATANRGCSYSVGGCTSSLAMNFYPAATDDDGSCVIPQSGCMSPQAINFDSLATVTSNDCVFEVRGCTDSLAVNYVADASFDDGSCIGRVEGCTAPSALNYDSLATSYAGGTCTYPVLGCTDSLATTYDPLATINDNRCVQAVYGCMFADATNFNSLATVDDGSCEMRPFGCTDPRALNYVPGAVMRKGTTVNLDGLPADGIALLQELNSRRIVHGATPLRWDTSLASDALDSASSCPSAGSSATRGELVAVGQAFINAAGVVSHWYSGELFYPYPVPGPPNMALAARWSDFTQVVWKASMSVGCGWSDYGSAAGQPVCAEPTWICRFAPSGNYLNGFQANVLPAIEFPPLEECIYLVVGCMSPSAINFDSTATSYEGAECLYSWPGCTDSNALNYLPIATEDDGACAFTGPEVVGCMDAAAANFDSAATEHSSCRYDVIGCMESNARNYASAATVNAGCIFTRAGCMSRFATNYDSTATVHNRTVCRYTARRALAEAGRLLQQGIPGCTYSNAENYNQGATIDDGSCAVAGCMDPFAPNFDQHATFNDGSCTSYLRGCTDSTAGNYATYYTVADLSSCRYGGCTESRGTANYDSAAAFDDGSCQYSTAVPGCTDSLADNFVSLATVNAGCTYGGCTTSVAPQYNPSATFDDGSCGALALGCTHSDAANYAPNATVDDGTCTYPDVGVVRGCADPVADNYNPSATRFAAGDDGLCQYRGCMTSAALNYDPSATVPDVSSCIDRRAGCTDSTADNYMQSANAVCGSVDNATGGGICATCAYGGCVDSINPSYDLSATYSDGTCPLVLIGCTDSTATNYALGATADDGNCRHAGCMDSANAHHSPSATFHDVSSCAPVVRSCTDSLAVNYLSIASDDDGSCHYVGCTYSTALNYDMTATDDSGRCEFASPPPTVPPAPPPPSPSTPPWSPPPPAPPAEPPWAPLNSVPTPTADLTASADEPVISAVVVAISIIATMIIVAILYRYCYRHHSVEADARAGLQRASRAKPSRVRSSARALSQRQEGSVQATRRTRIEYNRPKSAAIANRAAPRTEPPSGVIAHAALPVCRSSASDFGFGGFSRAAVVSKPPTSMPPTPKRPFPARGDTFSSMNSLDEAAGVFPASKGGVPYLPNYAEPDDVEPSLRPLPLVGPDVLGQSTPTAIGDMNISKVTYLPNYYGESESEAEEGCFPGGLSEDASRVDTNSEPPTIHTLSEHGFDKDMSAGVVSGGGATSGQVFYATNYYEEPSSTDDERMTMPGEATRV